MNEADATDEVLERDRRLIVASCLELLRSLRAILLYGGYGRGEGSWYQDPDGAWHPYNDYDVLIVSEQRVPKAELDALEERLGKEIGIRWIDLGLRSAADLRAFNQRARRRGAVALRWWKRRTKIRRPSVP
jgi:predicted nucleotidyltransferase